MHEVCFHKQSLAGSVAYVLKEMHSEENQLRKKYGGGDRLV